MGVHSRFIGGLNVYKQEWNTLRQHFGYAHHLVILIAPECLHPSFLVLPSSSYFFLLSSFFFLHTPLTISQHSQHSHYDITPIPVWSVFVAVMPNIICSSISREDLHHLIHSLRTSGHQISLNYSLHGFLPSLKNLSHQRDFFGAKHTAGTPKIHPLHGIKGQDHHQYSPMRAEAVNCPFPDRQSQTLRKP